MYGESAVHALLAGVLHMGQRAGTGANGNHERLLPFRVPRELHVRGCFHKRDRNHPRLLYRSGHEPARMSARLEHGLHFGIVYRVLSIVSRMGVPGLVRRHALTS